MNNESRISNAECKCGHEKDYEHRHADPTTACRECDCPSYRPKAEPPELKKGKTDLEPKPFTVPDSVIYIGFEGNGATCEVGAVPLELVPTEVLVSLCREFTHAVFQKAGKTKAPILIWDSEAGNWQ